MLAANYLREVNDSELASQLAKIHADLNRTVELLSSRHKTHTQRSSQAFSIGLLYESFTGKSITEHEHHTRRHTEHIQSQNLYPTVQQALIALVRETLDSLIHTKWFSNLNSVFSNFKLIEFVI